jgi:hypothetical protein
MSMGCEGNSDGEEAVRGIQDMSCTGGSLRGCLREREGAEPRNSDDFEGFDRWSDDDE